MESVSRDKAASGEVGLGRQPRERRMLNVPVLVVSILVLAVTVPATYAFHEFQVRRTAEGFLEEADRREADHDDLKAAEYLRRYLELHPKDKEKDADARARLAEVFDRVAADGRLKWHAIQYFYAALGAVSAQKEESAAKKTEFAPKDQALAEQYAEKEKAYAEKEVALRRRLAGLLFEMGKFGFAKPSPRSLFASAETEARSLLASNDHDSQGRRVLARALYSQFKMDVMAGMPPERRATESKATGNKSAEPKSISEWYDAALEVNPGDIELSRESAEILRDREHAEQLLDKKGRSQSLEERAKAADAVIDRMVSRNAENPEVYLVRYEYRVTCAGNDLRTRLKAQPEQWKILGAAADDAMVKAGSDLDVALSHGPSHLATLLHAAAHARAVGSIEARRGFADRAKAQYEKSRDFFERIIKLAPTDARGYAGLGGVYRDLGQEGQALATWQQGFRRVDAKNLRRTIQLENLDLYLRLADAMLKQHPDQPGTGVDQVPVQQVIDAMSDSSEKLKPLLPPHGWLGLHRSIRLIEARSLQSRGDYLATIPILQEVTEGEGIAEDQFMQAWVLLGTARSSLGQWEPAATAFARASTKVPGNARVQLAAATAWANMGRFEEAVPYYEKALAIESSAEAWFALAQARLQCQLRLPIGKRDWSLFIKALSAAQQPKDGKPVSDAWRTKLLEVDYRLARADERGERDQARRDVVQLLREAEKEYADSSKLLTRLVTAYEQLGYPNDADRVLESLARSAKTPAVSYLLRAALQTHRKQYPQARETLISGQKLAQPEMVPAFESALVQNSLQEGKTKQALDELAKLHGKYPANEKILRQLIELALAEKRFDESAKWEKDLQHVEGSGGVYWRLYEGQRTLAMAKPGDNDAIAHVTQLQQQIEREQPAWVPGLLLKAELAERRGNSPQAVEVYQEAIRLGERRVAVFERLISLLFAMQRYDDASQYLSRLQGQVPFSENLESLEVLLAAKRDKPEVAVSLARRAAEARPNDPMAWIRLAQMLTRDAKQQQEAENALHRAIQLAPTDARAREALFEFYVQTKQLAKARDALKDVGKIESLDAIQRATVLAQGYELVGDAKEAERNYREAVSRASNDPSAHWRLANFLLRSKDASRAEEVEQVLRRVVELSPTSRPAKRALAEVLAAQGGDRAWDEAQKLLEQSVSGSDVSSLDRRLQAVLLARRGGKNNSEKAKRLTEQLIADPKQATDGDRLLLAQLYEAGGMFQSTNQQYIALVGRPEPLPLHLTLYVDFLLRHREYDQAAPWLGQLETKAADAFETTALRGRWLVGRGELKKVEPLVESLAARLSKAAGKDEKKQLQMALAIGEIYSLLDQNSQAQRWYERVRQISPNRYQPLAMSLAKQGRMQEAIRLCVEAAKSDATAGPAITAASILASRSPRSEDLQLAEPLFSKALSDHKDDAGLLSSVAVVRVVAKQNEAAISVYRRLHSLNPKNALVLNNLASLLGEEPGRQPEALQYINDAIDIAGQQPALLDTKGMILLNDGKADEAEKCLEAAVSDVSPDPRFHFHLALARERMGDRAKARDSLDRARAGRVQDQILTAADRRMLAELEKKLADVEKKPNVK